MQVAESARCEKHDLAAGVGQGWIYVRVGGAKNTPGLQGWQHDSHEESAALPDLDIPRYFIYYI